MGGTLQDRAENLKREAYYASFIELKIKYFSSTSDDLSAIYDGIDKWLRETKHAGYQLNSTVHFHVEERKWYVIVTVMYQEPPGVGIIRPELIMNPRRAD